MTEFQVWIVFGTLSAGIVLFASQRIRYDVVSVLMLLALGLTGILSLDELFLGFASPAVITVASALVIARALYISGAIERLSDALLRFKSRPIVPFILLLAIVSLSSGFINDIAALAIALPLAVSLSRGLKLEPSKILIPLAYASIMGGALTLIGTASNIVMSSIARQELGRNLGIFEFAFVGLPLISVFLILVFVFGKRVLPVRASAYAHDKFELPRYIAEVQVSEKSRFVGKTAGELEKEYDGEIEVVRVVRGSLERELPHSNTKLRSGDFLVVRIEPEGLRRLTEDTGLQIKKNGEAEEDKIKGLEVVEAVVLPTSVLIERTARQIHLRDWLNVTLLGVARHRATLTRRVGDVRIKVGDVLLLEGAQADLATVFQELKCVPLGGRRVTLGPRAPQVLTLTIAGISIALSALGILPTEVALATGAVSMILLKSISIEEAYRSIQWPILLLIGTLIPFGIAMQKTGADGIIAEQLLQLGVVEPMLALAVLFVVTTLLSNAINNVATVVFMAPIAIRLAEILGVSGFPLLMCVTFAAAVPFLTPISHHSNLLVMEAGGYRFADYIRLGLPLTFATALIVLLLVPIFWPF